MKKYTKLINYLSFLTLLVAFGFLLIFGFWQFYPYKTIEFKNVPFPIFNENKTIEQGGVLVYKTEFCKYTDLEAKVARSFVDEVVYLVPTDVGVRPKGCGEVMVELTIPNTLPPATYKLVIDYTYEVNPIRTISIHEETESFLVVKKK